jgi:hypothetical protein
VVLRYHMAWKRRDLEAILAIYHPQVQYNDFFQNRSMGLDELRLCERHLAAPSRRISGAQ